MRWLIVLLMLAGCQTTGDIACDVETDVSRGRGVIIGPRTVLTVTHVVDKPMGLSVDGHAAHITTMQHLILDTGRADGVTVLELDDYVFPSDRIASTISNNDWRSGLFYLPARGREPWPWGLRAGDSGSPIVDINGNVVGLVRAVRGIFIAADEFPVHSSAR